MSIKFMAQRGDTIVEVMVAIVVISIILVAAYTTTSHNINTIEDTQEHGQALQLAQTQLEYLHNAGTTLPDGRAGGQCFDSTGTLTSGNSCMVDASDTPTVTQPQFTIDIAPVGSNPSVFQVTVSWYSASGPGKDNVTLFYQP